MNTNRFLKNPAIPILLAIALVPVFSGFWPCIGEELNQGVRQAYELRMNGQADSARALLEKVLSEDSTIAAAWFELARTKHHIGLGEPSTLIEGLGDIRRIADRAIENDSVNIAYSFYRALVYHTSAYASLMRRQSDAKQRIEEAISAYEYVLSLKPDYCEPMLYMVEILSIPEDMGGDRSKAESYATQLEEMDAVFGAKARELLLPEDAVRTEFWKEVLEQNPGNAEVLEQLGKAYLYQEDVEQGVEYLEAAMRADPHKETLLLDLARFYFMRSQESEARKETTLQKAEESIVRYLETDPVPPLEAYALNVLAWIKDGLGLEEEASALRAKAETRDANVSQAFGVPPLVLFAEPDEIFHHHVYFFRPF